MNPEDTKKLDKLGLWLKNEMVWTDIWNFLSLEQLLQLYDWLEEILVDGGLPK